MNINEVLSSSQQVMALELAVRSLAGGDAAIENAVALLAEETSESAS